MTHLGRLGLQTAIKAAREEADAQKKLDDDKAAAALREKDAVMTKALQAQKDAEKLARAARQQMKEQLEEARAAREEADKLRKKLGEKKRKKSTKKEKRPRRLASTRSPMTTMMNLIKTFLAVCSATRATRTSHLQTTLCHLLGLGLSQWRLVGQWLTRRVVMGRRLVGLAVVVTLLVQLPRSRRLCVVAMLPIWQRLWRLGVGRRKRLVELVLKGRLLENRLCRQLPLQVIAAKILMMKMSVKKVRLGRRMRRRTPQPELRASWIANQSFLWMTCFQLRHRLHLLTRG